MIIFIKKCFFIGSLFLSNLVSATSISCISMNNQPCKARSEIINVNSNNTLFYVKNVITCKCQCRLDASVCNNRQRWNKDKCRCECKELIDKCVCDKGYIWSPSNCECECDKSCDVGEYLDYKNCKCRKRLVDKLVDECNENIDEEVGNN